jgi:hypothetical protein
MIRTRITRFAARRASENLASLAQHDFSTLASPNIG